MRPAMPAAADALPAPGVTRARAARPAAPAPDARAAPAAPGATCARAALAAAALAGTGCEYNAEIRVTPQAFTSIDLLAACPAEDDAGEAGAMRIDLLFGSDLGWQIEVGQRVENVLTGERFEVEADGVSVEMFDTAGVGGDDARAIELAAERPEFLAGGRPVELALIVDHGEEADLTDPSGLRVAAAGDLAEQVLCGAREPAPRGCAFASGARLSLYALRNGAVFEGLQRSGDARRVAADLEEAAVVRGGEVPIFDAIAQAGEALGDAAAEGRAAVVVVTASGRDTVSLRRPDDVPADPPVLFATLSSGPEIERIACRNGGGVLVAGDIAGLARATRLARYALQGRWRVPARADLSGLPPGRAAVRSGVYVEIGEASLRGAIEFSVEAP